MLMYTVLCKLYLFLGRNSKNRLVQAVSKCGPLVFLSLFVAKKITDNHSSIVTDSKSNLPILLSGLVFCSIGDAYLVFENFFAIGVAAFAVGQILFFFLFGGRLSLLYEADSNEMAAGIAIGIVSAVLFLYFLPKLSFKFACLACTYCVLSSLTVWSAFVRFYHKLDDVTAIGLFGAVMFYTSDLMLSVDRWRMTLPFRDTLVMSTYYTAMISITGSILLST